MVIRKECSLLGPTRDERGEPYNPHLESSGVLDPFQRLQKNPIELNTVVAKAMVGGLDHPHLLGLTGPGKDCLGLLQRQEFVVSGVNLG